MCDLAFGFHGASPCQLWLFGELPYALVSFVAATSALLSSAVAASRPSNDSATITIQYESQLGADVAHHNCLIDSKPILTKVDIFMVQICSL